jgi:hypothetical protein
MDGLDLILRTIYPETVLVKQMMDGNTFPKAWSESQ